MTFFSYLKATLSESDGVPSNNRLMLFLLVLTLLGLLVAVTIKNNMKLPDIPNTLETLVEYLCTVFVSGSAVGKGVSAYKEVKTNAGTAQG